jgi:transcriptional regulator with XRE-family HTH domain
MSVEDPYQRRAPTTPQQAGHRWQGLRYPSSVEWTAATIRRFRAVGLCLSQNQFAIVLGFEKRTIGNAERGAHPPSLALRRALDQALEKASDVQRDRFLAAENEASDERTTPSATTSHDLQLAVWLGASLNIERRPTAGSQPPRAWRSRRASPKFMPGATRLRLGKC